MLTQTWTHFGVKIHKRGNHCNIIYAWMMFAEDEAVISRFHKIWRYERKCLKIH